MSHSLSEVLPVGTRLQAESEGAWYDAEVLEVSTAKKRAKTPVHIHFIGYIGEGSSEWCSVERLRSKVGRSSTSSASGVLGAAKVHVKNPAPKTPLEDALTPMVKDSMRELLSSALESAPSITSFSDGDQALLQHPLYRPDLQVKAYREGPNNQKSGTGYKKALPNLFKEGKVFRVLAASLSPSLVERFKEEFTNRQFKFSPADRSGFPGGAKRPTAPMPVFIRVCDVMHRRGVAAPCLQDFVVFDPLRWTLVTLDASSMTGLWLAVTFNVATHGGPWQITVTQNGEIIVAFPIVDTACSSYEMIVGRCQNCYGCRGRAIWACLPSVPANCVRADIYPVLRVVASTYRLECSCGRWDAKNPLHVQFSCTCEPCGGMLREWATAVDEFSRALQAGNEDAVRNAIARLNDLSTGVPCHSCRKDRECVAAAIATGRNLDILDSLAPWVDQHTLILKVSDIRFSQDAISASFTDGKDIEDTVRQLRLGMIRPEDLPAINVVRYHGQYMSLDHRRLWSLQQFELLELSDEDVCVTVVVCPLKVDDKFKRIREFNKKLSTTTDGSHMLLKKTPVHGSGTQGMNRTALSSVVLGDLRSVRGQREKEQQIPKGMTFGGRQFGTVRSLQEEVQLIKGNNSAGHPLEYPNMQLLLDVLGFHDADARRSLQDIVCVTVSGSETFSTPCFWLWNKSGEGRDAGAKKSLENLKYYLKNSPEQNLLSVDALSDEDFTGCIKRVGPQFGYIEATERPQPSIGSSGDIYFTVWDSKQPVSVGAVAKFRLYRWKADHQFAGMFAAASIRIIGSPQAC